MVFKKSFLGLMMLGFLLLSAGRAHAYKDVNYITLNDSAGTSIAAYTVTGQKTSAAFKTRDNVGFMTLVLDISGGAILVTHQVSLDGVTWYAPSTTDGTTLTSAPSVVSNLSTSSWIIMTARMAPFIRFIFSQVSGTPVITAKVVYQSELNL